MSTYTKYERGSVWRKWDLQVATNHYTNYGGLQIDGASFDKIVNLTGLTPAQINSDHRNLSDVEYAKLFIEYLVHISPVNAVAIMNHNTGKGIHEIINYLQSKQDFSVKNNIYNDHIVFPGVEIGGCDRCHILIVFNPETTNTNKFIYNNDGIKVSEKSWDVFIEDFLSEVHISNQRFVNGAPSNSRDLGALDIISIADEWDFVPIFPHICNSDGWWRELQESNRKEIYNSKYFGIVDSKTIGNNQNLKRILDGLHTDWGKKEIAQIQTSDSKSLSEIGRNFSWIKADLSFTGLKQIIYEPKSRVNNGANLPEDKAGYQIIDRIEISNDLIYNQSLLFNANLNSIIGGRSSGKSILLGAVAKKLKTSRPIKLEDNNYDAFVQEISNSIKVFWKDGEEDNNREVEYFQQGYMHEIARSNEKLNLLIQEILNQKGKDTIIASYEKYISENSKKISSFISDYFQTLKFISEKEQKARDTGDKKGIEEEIRKLKEESVKLAVATISDDDKSTYEIIKEEINKQIQQRKTIENDSKQIQILKQVSIFREDLSYDLISLSDVRKEEIEDFYNSLKSETENKWRAKLEEIEKNILLATEGISQKIIELESNSTYKKVLEAYQKNDQLSEFENKIKIQNAKLFEINTVLGEIQNLKKQKEEIFDKITSALKAYFLKTQEIIPELTAAKDGLVINVREKFETNKYQSILYSGLNQQGVINQSISSFEYRDNNSFEEHILNVFKKLSENVLTLKGGYSNQSLATNLLSSNFYSLDYDVQYEGDDFRKMSDGKKAFVVLKLLLDFSDKNCPILIDQPEDDLDNRAIYNDLVLYLRNKKQLRQIIVATHNPNIVVGADSELVIVANQNGERNLNNSGKKFQYVAGSLEHTFPKNGATEILVSQGTREHVCEVLEGGNIAFKLREKKYSIKE